MIDPAYRFLRVSFLIALLVNVIEFYNPCMNTLNKSNKFMSQNELVSIITPLYNAEKYIALTIESVIEQSYQNWEMIIVDDCSADSSIEIVREFTTDSRIKLLQQTENSGPAACRNKAIEKAQGRYIAFLDSDDLWNSEKLSKQIAFMKKNEAVLSYTNYQKMDGLGNVYSKVISVPLQLSYSQLLNSNQIGCLTAIYDCKKIGKHYQMKTGHEDYVLWLSILKQGYLAHGLRESLAYYRIGNVSISSNKFKMMGFQWNIYRNIEKLSIFKSSYHFLWYAYKGFKKSKVK